MLVDAWQPGENRSVRRLAQRVIWAAPVFQAPQVFRELSSELAAAIGEFQYAPWLVANLSLRGFPEERRGAPLAWDNVLYDSDALGYVVATHQHLAVHQDQTVFTGITPSATDRQCRNGNACWRRRGLCGRSRFCAISPDRIPTSAALVTRLDLMRWGHAMTRPRPGFIWGEARQRLLNAQDRVLFAHSDLSGYSIFEEANYRGVLAAERVLAASR